jgi:hypothetical protein
MKSFILGIAILIYSAQVLAAPSNVQLNNKIKRLIDRVTFLEGAMDDLKKSSTGYVFAGFTAENIDPVVPDAFNACRTEYGPKASVATTREVLEALRDGSFFARGDGYVFSSEAEYNMGVPRDRYLHEVLHGPFIVVGIGGKTFHMTVGEAPVACSTPIASGGETPEVE